MSTRSPNSARRPSIVTLPATISSSHARLLPYPMRASTFCTRSTGAEGCSAPDTSVAVRCSSERRPQPLFELTRYLGTGQEVLDRRELVDSVETQALEEEIGGAVEHRLTG